MIALTDDPTGYEGQGIVKLCVGKTRSSIPASQTKWANKHMNLPHIPGYNEEVRIDDVAWYKLCSIMHIQSSPGTGTAGLAVGSQSSHSKPYDDLDHQAPGRRQGIHLDALSM
jgi:hypothetical protein